MKLKNKKTGKVIKLDVHWIDGKNYESLAEVNSEWEDYEEPKEHWCVTMYGGITRIKDDEEPIDDLIEIGNYFNSKEDAYDAWDKLKAWKRLKDKGFRPKMWEWEYIYDDNISGELIIKAHIDDATDSDGKYTKDLDLLFCPEENI